MNKQKQNEQCEEDHYRFLISITALFILVIFIFIIITTVRLDLQSQIDNLPHKVCWNETIDNNISIEYRNKINEFCSYICFKGYIDENTKECFNTCLIQQKIKSIKEVCEII